MENSPNGAYTAVFRNRYFDGKFMTAGDFATDPDYLLERHRLHNRLLHGWGIAEGLEVVRHPNEDCCDRWVRIEPGVAVDRLGREIVLAEPAAVEVVPAKAADEGPFVLFIAYGEEAVEPVPALYAEGIPDPDHREPNRLREVPRFQVVRAAEAGPDEWPSAEGTSAPDGRVPAAALGRVALALAGRPATGKASPELDINSTWRRLLPPALTTVQSVSWPHGGTLALDPLRDAMKGVLKVSFSRPLRPSSGGTGIGPWTFRVASSAGPAAPAEPVPGTVVAVDDRAEADFQIAPEALAGLAGRTVLVTLKCDFLLDGMGLPVDGGHLGGRLPGGRGTPGGSFESWFHVVAAAKTQEESHGGQ